MYRANYFTGNEVKKLNYNERIKHYTKLNTFSIGMFQVNEPAQISNFKLVPIIFASLNTEI